MYVTRNRFSFTRAAPSTSGRAKTNYLPVTQSKQWSRLFFLATVSAFCLVYVQDAAAATNFTFAAFGDVRGDGANTPATPIVATPIMEAFATAMHADGVELAIVNGDLILGQTDPTYTNMNTYIPMTAQFAAYTNTMTNFTGRGITIYPVRGNHEIASNCSTEPSPVEAWMANIGQYLPQNGPPGEEGMTYSFIHSNALFLCVDQYGGTNSTEANPYPLVNQAWVEQQLKTNTQKHVFVIGHTSCFQSMLPCLSSNVKARTAFWECMSTNGVHLYFCGHDHYYLRSTASISNSLPMQQVVVGACTEALIFWPGYYPELGQNGVNLQTEAYFGLEPYQAFYRLLSSTTNVVVTGLTSQGFLNSTCYASASVGSTIHEGSASMSFCDTTYNYGETQTIGSITSGGAGFTTKGELSSQNFQVGSIGVLEDTVHSACIYMTGTHEPVFTTKDKVKCAVCGVSSNYGSKFCSCCGTYIAK